MLSCCCLEVIEFRFAFFLHTLVQGHLDLQYLNTRFEKGKEAVASKMHDTHRFAEYPNGLAFAQPDIVAFQQQLGGNAFL